MPADPKSDFPAIGDDLGQQKGQHFSLVRLGPVNDLRRYGVKHPLIDRPGKGKVFLHRRLDLTGMEISFGLLPARAALPFRHKHRVNEEVYLFLRGRGQMLIDGEVLNVEEGTAVRVSPDGDRTLRNTGDDDLFYVVIQAKEGSLTQWTGSDGIGIPEPVVWPE